MHAVVFGGPLGDRWWFCFSTCLKYRLDLFFLPVPDDLVAGTEGLFQSWDGLQAYAYPLLH